MMADARPFDTGVKVIAGLSGEARVELASQKGGHVVGLDGVDDRADQWLIEGLQVLAGPKDDVRGVFKLHEAPVNAGAELADDGTQFASVLIESAVELLDLEAVHDCLGLGEVVDEIEIVVEALGLPPFQEGWPRLLVVPGAERRAGLDGRKNVHQPRMIAALLEEGLDPLLFAEVFLGEVVDGQPVLGGEAFGVGSDFIAQRFGELGVVEEANSADPQRLGHRFGVGDVDETAGEDDAVETGQRADDLVGVDFSEPSHAGTLMPIVATRRHAA